MDASGLTRGLGDTIVAVSSPRGPGERGIVRVSGDDAVKIVGHGFEPASGAPSPTSIRYGTTTGRFRIGRSGVAAPVTLWIMRAPRSFTREDQVEIHAQGSPLLLEILVELRSPRASGRRPWRNGTGTATVMTKSLHCRVD